VKTGTVVDDNNERYINSYLLGYLEIDSDNLLSNIKLYQWSLKTSTSGGYIDRFTKFFKSNSLGDINIELDKTYCGSSISKLILTKISYKMKSNSSTINNFINEVITVL